MPAGQHPHPRDSVRLVRALGATLVLLLGGCTWTPEARPVTPELIARGTFKVRGTLDAEARHVWVQRVGADGEAREAIVDMTTRRICELPVGMAPIGSPLEAPPEFDDVKFLWALRRIEDGEVRLSWSNERCQVEDTDTPAGGDAVRVVLDDDGGTILLVGTGTGTLRYVDPFRGDTHVIGKGITRYSLLQRPGAPGDKQGQQALWLVEDGELRLRTLEGDLLARIEAKDVSEFEQAAFSTTRLTFVSEGNLYEAVAPDYVPLLIAKDACQPFYSGTDLSFSQPCSSGQLVRIDLTTGEVQEFEPGVFWQWEERGFELEYATGEDGVELWITPPDAEERLRVEPTLGDLQVLDDQTIAGRDDDARFGLYDVGGRFRPVLEGVASLATFVDVRTSGFLWVAQHEVEDGLGQLALVYERDLLKAEKLTDAVIPVAEDVPVGGFSFGYLLQVPEPIVMIVRDAETTPIEDTDAFRFRGTLEASFVGGELAATIDEGVTSYALVPSPSVGGILYSVDREADTGLWFAAL